MKKYVLILLFCQCYLWVNAQADVQKKLQTQFILVEDGETIVLDAGTIQLTASLSLDGKKNITIRGAGMDKTIISFKGQTQGAEGIRISNAKNITLENMTVQDSKGDCIKAQSVDGITFRNVKVEWTGKASKKNGAYGLYPVQCSRVLIEKCESIGASDAGIYVGQSHQIVVRNCRAYRNVAGIEIENSTMADVYDNEATDNTGGILVFDLPDLIKKHGGNVRIFNNVITKNNHRNFAPKGNIVGQVPAGTGIMVLATNNVEIFNNKIIDNKTAGTAIVSYYITELPIQDSLYNPYPSAIYIHDNQYQRSKQMPTLKNKMGLLFYLKFGRTVPDIIYDGIENATYKDANGNYKPAYQICIQKNGKATFVNLDAANDFKKMSRDLSRFDCTRTSLDVAKLKY